MNKTKSTDHKTISSLIVKRKGHTEPYDIRKLYASIYAACLSVRVPVGSAELICEEVCEAVGIWLHGRHEVTANDIRREATKHLSVYNPDAGYMYGRHRNMI